MTAHDLPPSPLADPAGYPGERPAADYLLIGTQIRPLALGPDGWRIGSAGPPEGGPPQLLHDLLGGPVHARRPVVAFGSNAAPAQLLAKFGSVDAGIPVTRGRLRGFGLAHSAHVSAPGYVPWVLVDEPGAVLDCAVLWLDRGQRARLDVTEPNYDLVSADPARYPLRVPGVHASIGYSVYRGRRGALRRPGDDRPIGATSQAYLFDRLGALDWFGRLVGDGDLRARQRRLAADARLRERVRDEFTARGMAGPDGWVVTGGVAPG